MNTTISCIRNSWLYIARANTTNNEKKITINTVELRGKIPTSRGKSRSDEKSIDLICVAIGFFFFLQKRTGVAIRASLSNVDFLMWLFAENRFIDANANRQKATFFTHTQFIEVECKFYSLNAGETFIRLRWMFESDGELRNSVLSIDIFDINLNQF